MMIPKRILFVDDSPSDRELVLAAFETIQLSNGVTALQDGAEALDYLYRRGEFEDFSGGLPAMILLDLKMQKVDGFQFLRQIRNDPALRLIPVVIMSSSREEQDLLKAYQLGANAYVVKPLQFGDFIEAVKNIGTFWAMLNEPSPGNSRRSKF